MLRLNFLQRSVDGSASVKWKRPRSYIVWTGSKPRVVVIQTFRLTVCLLMQQTFRALTESIVRFVCLHVTLKEYWFTENEEWINSTFFRSDICRELAFEGVFKDKALNKSIVRNVTVHDEELCQWKCFLDDTCKSYNLGPPQVREEGKRVCELSSSHHVLHPEHLVSRPGFIYRSSVVSLQQRDSISCKFIFLKEQHRKFLSITCHVMKAKVTLQPLG